MCFDLVYCNLLWYGFMCIHQLWARLRGLSNTVQTNILPNTPQQERSMPVQRAADINEEATHNRDAAIDVLPVIEKQQPNAAATILAEMAATLSDKECTAALEALQSHSNKAVRSAARNSHQATKEAVPVCLRGLLPTRRRLQEGPLLVWCQLLEPTRERRVVARRLRLRGLSRHAPLQRSLPTGRRCTRLPKI